MLYSTEQKEGTVQVESKLLLIIEDGEGVRKPFSDIGTQRFPH